MAVAIDLCIVNYTKEEKSITMPKEITTEILIKTSPEKVWAILTDFENYPSWNPFVRSISGQVKVGNNITVRLQQPKGKEMTFKPKVIVFESNKEFRWQGHLLFPGIFDGEHKFELIANGNGTTTFRHSEKFKGILVPLLSKQLYTNTRKGFEEMNEKYPKSDMGIRTYPPGLYYLLKKFGKYHLPIYVTENGIANANDEMRQRFIAEHIGAIEKAINEGISVKGYFNWALLDTYEWKKGYELKFGLIEVDYTALARRLRVQSGFFNKFK